MIIFFQMSDKKAAFDDACEILLLLNTRTEDLKNSVILYNFKLIFYIFI